MSTPSRVSIERRARIRAAILADPTKSTAALQRETGCATETIRSVRATLSRTKEIPAIKPRVTLKRASFEIRQITKFLEGISQYCSDISNNMSNECLEHLLNPTHDNEEACKTFLIAAIRRAKQHLDALDTKLTGPAAKANGATPVTDPGAPYAARIHAGIPTSR